MSAAGTAPGCTRDARGIECDASQGCMKGQVRCCFAAGASGHNIRSDDMYGDALSCVVQASCVVSSLSSPAHDCMLAKALRMREVL